MREASQRPLGAELSEPQRTDREGWLSASLHRSLDGTRVVNYAQSSDPEAARRVIDHLRHRGLLEANKAFGTAAPGLYEVAFTLDRE